MSRPASSSYAAYYTNYIALVKEDDLMEGFRAQQQQIDTFLASITEEQSTQAYAPGKWTIKELMLHIIDTERVFGYRAMCFARGEKQSLPGFDENEFAAASKAVQLSWKDLLTQLQTLRASSISLFAGFDEEQLNASGKANNNPLSVRAAGFIILGHLYHHVNILKERYLQ